MSERTNKVEKKVANKTLSTAKKKSPAKKKVSTKSVSKNSAKNKKEEIKREEIISEAPISEAKDILLIITALENKINAGGGNVAVYDDLLSMCNQYKEFDKETAYEKVRFLRHAVGEALREERSTDNIMRLKDIIKRTHLIMAQDSFDDYCIYLEWNREPEKRFYLPRRSTLKILADDLQDLADRKIDFLGVSLPPRVGKSSLSIMFIAWLMGRNPDKANLMSGHSDKLTDGFFREISSILTDTETYLWHDVFPGIKVADISAKNETIDLNRKKRFPTFTARSVGGTLTGAVEVGEGGCLYVDDLIEDLEESLNPVRLQAKYDAYLNQLKDRKKNGAFELMVGTRWNVADPLGRIQEQYKDNPRYRFRVIPAIDENGHSNFDYRYGLGFDDAYYKDMKESIDDATWCAKYMGHPYVREGLLFPAENLRYYNGELPEGDPDKIAVCDVAWGGGDSLSMPFAFIYGSDIYIHDVIFSKGDKTVTQPMIVNKIKELEPYKARFEANNGGGEYAAAVDDMLRKQNIHINISTQRAPTTQSKVGRIIKFSPEIKRFYFRDEKSRSAEYSAFMSEVCTFSQLGKNPHDDAPDSLAMLADEIFHGSTRVEIGNRLF